MPNMPYAVMVVGQLGRFGFDFPILDGIDVFDFLPARNHGPRVGQDGMAGGDHINVNDHKG